MYLSMCPSDAGWVLQHYGYEFNYQTLLLDKPHDIHPVPPDIVDMISTNLYAMIDSQAGKESLSGSQDQQSPHHVCTKAGGVGDTVPDMLDGCNMEHIAELCTPQRLTQLTINEYYPDQGIAPHIGMSSLPHVDTRNLSCSYLYFICAITYHFLQ